MGQNQGGKQATRAEPDHHRAFGEASGCLCDRVISGIRCRPHVLIFFKAGQNGVFVARLQINNVNELDLGVFLAGIVAALEHGELRQVGVVDAQTLDDSGSQGTFGVLQRQRQFGKADHNQSCAALAADGGLVAGYKEIGKCCGNCTCARPGCQGFAGRARDTYNERLIALF